MDWNRKCLGGAKLLCDAYGVERSVVLNGRAVDPTGKREYRISLVYCHKHTSSTVITRTFAGGLATTLC